MLRIIAATDGLVLGMKYGEPKLNKKILKTEPKNTETEKFGS